MSKFHPNDLTNPLYEYSQVITIHELRSIYLGLVEQYKDSKWWEIRQQYRILLAGRVIHELLSWLNEGKPKLKNTGEK